MQDKKRIERLKLLYGFNRWILLTITIALMCLTASPASASDTYRNPVIPGFHPDPSICRVEDDYYLVNSSFEYFPGVPIFHSKDLVHWRQIGHVLTRESQLPLHEMQSSGGIFAPTLRYHEGTFYMITTNVYGGGNFYVTAGDPAGPWSDPVWLDESGIDPSLFFDDDGTVYYTRHVGQADGYIGQTVLNLESGELQGPLKKIWEGTGGIWPEGPHIYKRDGIYYLSIAEGGTSYGHMQTVARSDHPMGPYESNPDNPILTHKHLPNHPIQALGHADLVNTPDGWWLVCLGIRPKGGQFHHLGRETFLAPVEWTSERWLVVNDDGTIDPVMEAPGLSPHPWEEPSARDEFEGDSMRVEWNYLRNPNWANYSLSERPGYLRLWGSAVTMNDRDSPTFVGRRQTAFTCTVSTQLDFEPQHGNEEAGLVLRGNDDNHFEIGITRANGDRQVFLRKIREGKIVDSVKYMPAPEGEVILTVEAKALSYEFFFQGAGSAKTSLGTGLTKHLSSEKIGGFTGVYIGLYATGNGQAVSVPADFDWFEYSPDSGI